MVQDITVLIGYNMLHHEPVAESIMVEKGKIDLLNYGGVDYIAFIWVDPDFRRLGVGTQLISKLTRTTFCIIHDANRPAQDFFRSVGFDEGVAIDGGSHVWHRKL